MEKWQLSLIDKSLFVIAEIRKLLLCHMYPKPLLKSTYIFFAITGIAKKVTKFRESWWICLNFLLAALLLLMPRANNYILESFQDFLIELDMKPRMQIVENEQFFTKWHLPKLWTTSMNISKFSKLLFSVQNWLNLSEKIFLWRMLD